MVVLVVVLPVVVVAVVVVVGGRRVRVEVGDGEQERILIRFQLRTIFLGGFLGRGISFLSPLDKTHPRTAQYEYWV